MNYVVIVNWNGSIDTIECLESLLRLRTDDLRIVVCDNGSTDGSISQFMKWGEGGVVVSTDGPPWLKLRDKVRQFDIRHPRTVRVVVPDKADPTGDVPFVTILQIGRNLGFAGASNLGLRYALGDPAASGFWLLNNDTIVAPSALDAILSRCSNDEHIGMCAATLVYYYDPDVIQGAGAGYDAKTGRGRCLAIGLPLEELPKTEEIERNMAYVIGASLFVTRGFVEAVGLMNEEYFLYFEEIDWAIRGQGRFRMAFARDAIVFHKEGRSIGSKSFGRPSDTSLYYLTVNALRFTNNYYPSMLSRVCARIALDITRCVRHKNLRSALVMTYAARDWLLRRRHTGLRHLMRLRSNTGRECR
jgi:GT2 family glycosyltransferase